MTTHFRSLDRAEMEALMARQSVGRLAYLEGQGVQIEPIHFVFEGGWIYGRTEPGSKISALAHRPWVAFEVDEVHGLFEWQSVVVRGHFQLLSPAGTVAEQRQVATAIAALRRLVPGTLGPDDPVPDRQLLFAIHADDAQGRAAHPTP
jgi:uncharacterized protein